MLVRNIHAGPFEGLTKDELPGQLCVFAREVLRSEASQPLGHYAAVHSHYWLSGQVGALARDRWGVPLVHSMHTMAKVKNDALAEGDTPEPPARIIGEEQVVEAADLLIANTDTEAKQLINLYDACASPRRGDPPRRGPRRVPPARPGRRTSPSSTCPGRDGRHVRRPDPAAQGPDVLLRAVHVLLDASPTCARDWWCRSSAARRAPASTIRRRSPSSRPARPRRRRALRPAGGAGRARRVVRRGRPGRRTVLQRVVRPGRRRGPGVGHAGRRRGRRRPDHRGRGRPQRGARRQPRRRGLGRRAGPARARPGAARAALPRRRGAGRALLLGLDRRADAGDLRPRPLVDARGRA